MKNHRGSFAIIGSTEQLAQIVLKITELIFQLAPESYAFQATLHRKKDRHNDQATALLLPPPLTTTGGRGSLGSSGRGFP